MEIKRQLIFGMNKNKHVNGITQPAKSQQNNAMAKTEWPLL